MKLTALKPLHICVGSVADLDYLQEGVDSGTPIRWLVPKTAKRGDSVLFLLPSLTGPFEAWGAVMKQPTKSLEWHNKYESMVGHLEFLPEPVPLKIVQSKLPDWKYLTNAKAYITVPTQFLDTLVKVIKEFKPEEHEDNIQQASDLTEPEGPTRALCVTTRIVRDTPLARKVKAAHNNQCQICGVIIQFYGGQTYSEAHHIKPLGSVHKGPDVAENIICVCPNCHAQLDYGAIEINKRALFIADGHKIAGKYIDYHNSTIFKGKNSV